MADYRFKDAEGKVHIFRGPAGLSQSDVDLFASNYFGAPEPEPMPLPAKKPETGLIPSIKRGAMQTSMLMGDILPAMGARLVGADEYADRQLREAAETQRQIQERYPAAVPSFTDIKGLGDFATYVKEAVGEAIPSILPGLFTGGAATVLSRGAVAAAKEAAEVAARNSIAKGVAREEAEQLAMQAGIQAARRTALKYQAAGAFAGSAAQNIPDVYQNILEETGKEDLGAALVSGGFNAVLDAILPVQLLRKAKIAGIPEQEIVGAWYKRGATGLGKGFLTEGATEAVQEMSSAAAEAFVGENSDFFTTKNLIRFIDAGLKGGVGGGVISGAADVVFGRAPTEEQARREGPTPTAEDLAAEEAAIGLRPAAPQPEQLVTPPAKPTDAPGIAPGALERIQSTPPTTTEAGKPSKAAQLEKAQADLVQMKVRGAPEPALNKKRKQIERLTNEIAAESQALEGATDVAGIVPPVRGTSVQVFEPAAAPAVAPGAGEPQRDGMVPTGTDAGVLAEGERTEPGAVEPILRTKDTVQNEINAIDEQRRALLSKDGRAPRKGTEKFKQWEALDKQRTKLFYEWGALDLQENEGKKTEPAAPPSVAPTPAPAPAPRTEEDLTLEEDPLFGQAITQLQGGVSVEEFADLNGISMNRAEVLYQEAQDYLDSEGVAYPDVDAAIDEKEAAPAEAPKVTKATKEPKRITAGGQETRTGRPSIMGGRTVPAYVQRELQKGNSKALLNILRTAAPNPVHRAIAQFLYKNELFPTVTLVKSLPGNRVAQYNPRTRSIDITEKAVQDPGVLLHEYVHDATIKVLNAYLTGGKLTAGQRQGAQHMQYLMQESRPTLERFFPEAYTNLYEFASYGLTNEEFAKALSKIQVPANKSYTKDASLWERFVKAVSDLIGFTSKDIEELGVKLGAPYDADKQAFKLTRKQIEEARGSDEAVMRRAGLMPNAMNTEVFSAFMDIVAPPPAAGVDMPSLPATMQAEPIDTSDEGRMAQFEKDTEIKERGFKKTLKNWMTKRGAIALTTNFQNDRYALKRWEDKVSRFGLIDRITDKLNNIYGQITRSAATGVDIFNTNMKNLTEEVHNSVQAYAELTGVDTRKALSRLHLILEARHEPERRRVKYILNVPLNPLGETINVNELIEDSGLRALFPKSAYSPSGFREQVMKILSTPTPGIDDVERAARARELRAALDKVVDNTANHDLTVTTRKDKKGRTVKLEDPFNEQGPDYSVIGGRTPQDIALITRTLDTAENKTAIDRVAKAVKDVTDKSVELNKRANYFSQPTSNVVDFYGFNNYVPFKGRPGATQLDEELEIGSKLVGGELQEGDDRMEGRLSESENPILQILADGAASSLRLGRKDLTLAIKNAVQQNLMRGKADVKITFEDRYLDRVSKQTIGGPDKIFHYNEDGTIDVIQIGDRDLSQAIRRQYRESSPIIDVANNITSFVGMMHTRYNPSFAPMNFVRDVLTNAFTLGAELGPSQSVRLINQVAGDVASGGMFKTLNFARLYTAGKFDELRKLAAKDPYYKDIQDYVEQGGKVSYLQGIAAKGALDQLIEEVGARQVGQNKIVTLLKKKDIDRFLDIYNDMFELASRVATYRVMRDTMTSKNVERGMGKADAEKDATIQAVEYAKNLANFEQVGKYGKEAGSLFMFFRPAATGAVRAIEALSPAFMKFDKEEFKLEGERLGATPEQIDRAVKEMQQRKASARRMSMGLVGMGMMIYFMAVMMAGDDDEGRNRVLTDDMARWTRYARFHIPGTEIYFQIPWGFGLGFFASLGAQLGAVLTGKNSIADAFGNSIPTFLDSFLPLPVSRINPFENPGAFVVDSALPSVARPIVEYMMNIDGLGREIYNNRQSRFGDAYTGGDNIPEMYKSAARSIFNMTNGAIDISPNSLFFFASNYADGFAKVMSNATNLAMTATGYKEPDIRNDVALLASFFGSKSNVDAREFSKVEKDILDMSKRINALKNQPEALERYLRDHATDYALVQFYNQAVNGTLRQLREAANVIRANPELTPKERKAQVDEIVKLQNYVKRDILNGFEAVGGIKP